MSGCLGTAKLNSCRVRFYALMAVAMLAGCATAPPPPAATSSSTGLSPTDYDSFKNMYLSTNPDARVGRVEAVLPDEHRLAVGDIPTSDFQVGDVVSIVDGSLNVVADGRV